MKLFFLAYTAAFLYCSNASAFPRINEIMYAPLDASNEWFELTNTGDSIDLQNWKWKDATASLRFITAQSFTLHKDSFVVICQDSSKFKTQFPLFKGKLFQTLWIALNNSGDNLILINESGERTDSVAYSSGWGGNTGGYSLERKNPAGISNFGNNWGSCTDIFKATPGTENSIRIKELDLTIKRFETEPFNPVAGGLLELSAVVSNTGASSSGNAALNFYDDSNLDSIGQQSELVNSFTVSPLNPEDSLTFEMTLQDIAPGRKQLIVSIIFEPDQDTSDNKIVRSVNISQPGQAGSIVINEIMYEPLTGDAEWVEMYNPSSIEFDLKQWKLRDNTGTVDISDSSLIISPGGYLIIASDSSILSTYNYLKNANESVIVRVIQSLSLNNSGESLVVEDSLLTAIDKLTYSPSMHNPEIDDTRGVSLERINPALPSSYSNNWSSSADPSGGTPGKRNSIFASAVKSSSELMISPNPFSPDGDGRDDVALISCSFSFSKGTIRANIYDIKGRMVRTLANNEQTGSEKAFLFNGYSDNNEKLSIGLYIVLIEAIDQTRGEPVTVKAPLVIAAKL